MCININVNEFINLVEFELVHIVIDDHNICSRIGDPKLNTIQKCSILIDFLALLWT